MQLRRAAVLALLMLGGLAIPAFADGELSLRTVYYKERATRVEQPMLDGRFDVGEHGSVEGHVLIDAITSASMASSADGAPFDEKRLEGGLGYTHTLGVYQLGATAKYSTEPDYKSAFGTVHGQAELFRRNLTLGFTVGAGHDDVYKVLTPAGDLSSYLLSVSVAQIVSRNAIASITYDLSYLDGFQSNPYRTVAIRTPGGPLPEIKTEVHPDTRARHAIAGSLRYFVERTSTTVIGAYRFYQDDWGVRAHTPELRLVQDAGETMQVGLRYRYYRQSASDFFAETYPPNAPLFTDDPKLTKFDAHLFAMKFDVTGATFGLEDRLGAVEGELVIEYNLQHNAFGRAAVVHAALTFPFEY